MILSTERGLELVETASGASVSDDFAATDAQLHLSPSIDGGEMTLERKRT